MIGIVGQGTFETTLADSEQVMPLLARALLPGWIAGLMLAGAIAAMMSTADSQLIVVTSSIVEDVYVKLLKLKSNPRTLVLISRLATIAVSVVALILAFSAEDTIFDLVSYAWAGLGASFGAPLLLALRWKRTTAAGALSGMIAGSVSNVIWKNVPALNDALDLKLASFVIALLVAIAVSLATAGKHDRSPAR
jgi:sodium/proline symporter